MNDLIDRYAPSLVAVYDYFPFGMLMPGRYLQDDATHCMTITQTQIVPVRVPVIDHVTGPFSPVKGGSGIFVPLDDEVVITGSSAGSGVEISHSVTAGAALALELEVKTVEYGSFSVVISEEVAGKQVVLGGIGIQARGAYSASVVPQSSTVKVSITASSAQAQGARLIIKPYVWTWTVPTPKAVPVVVCNDREDYRFGFNGKEKDNEIKGIGNSLDFNFRMYDSRLGKFLSVDPLTYKYPYYSPYQFAGNNPIKFIDVEGLEPSGPPNTWHTSKVSALNDGTVMYYARGRNDASGWWVHQRQLPKMQGHEYKFHDGKQWEAFRNDADISRARMKAANEFSDKMAQGLLHSVDGALGIMSGGASLWKGVIYGALIETSKQVALNQGNISQVDWIDVGVEAAPGKGLMGHIAKTFLTAAFDYQKGEFNSIFDGSKAYDEAIVEGALEFAGGEVLRRYDKMLSKHYGNDKAAKILGEINSNLRDLAKGFINKAAKDKYDSKKEGK